MHRALVHEQRCIASVYTQQSSGLFLCLCVSHRGIQPIEGDTQHLFKGYDGKLVIGILPVSVFCSGHTFFTQRLFQKLKLEVGTVAAIYTHRHTHSAQLRLDPSGSV